MFSANSLKIVYQDDYLMVLDKPAGLIVTTSDTNKDITVSEILQNEFGIPADRGGIVHRLDKDTSGLLLVGKTDEMVLELQSQFKNRTVQKEYIALVHGEIEKAGEINGAISRHLGDRTKFEVSPGGREATTQYEPVKHLHMPPSNIEAIFEEFNSIQMRKLGRLDYDKFTLVRCHPLTGRTHQIRVHLKYLGYPLVSDDKYGGRKVVRLDRRWCPRQFLHAAKLSFGHPKTGERLSFESELPEDLQKALGYLSS